MDAFEFRRLESSTYASLEDIRRAPNVAVAGTHYRSLKDDITRVWQNLGNYPNAEAERRLVALVLMARSTYKETLERHCVGL